MVAILEERVRCVDLETNNYYDLLYSFHIHRGNYRKAASAIYEHASRLAVELPGVESLERQCTCYLATLNTLRIVDPKYLWIVKPVAVIVEPKLENLIGASPKRDYDGDSRNKPVTRREVKVIEMTDIEREYLLILARRVRISHSGADNKTWQWLSANSLSKLHCSKESSPADLAWQLLKVYLERHHCPGDSTHYKVVTTKLLSLGFTLPQWLIRSLKLVDCPALLRLYISYDKLEDATLLAIELINAVTGELGDGYKDFGMKDPLRSTTPSVWLPYSSLDHILLALQKSKDLSLHGLYQTLNAKMIQYQDQARRLSKEMVEIAIRRQQDTMG